MNKVEEVEVMDAMTIEMDITTTEMITGMPKIAQTMATMDIIMAITQVGDTEGHHLGMAPQKLIIILVHLYQADMWYLRE